MTRPAFDPADSALFERQEAALSMWTEKLKEKQRLFAEREHVFKGTRLALGGPRRRRVSPPAASPAPDHSPRRVGVSHRAAAASSLASPLLAHTPAASFAEPPTSPRHSGFASHLGSTEAPPPEAQLFTPPASSSRRKGRTRRHKTNCFQQLPVVSTSDCFSSSSFDSSLKTNNRLISDPKASAISKSVTVPVYANPRPAHSRTVLSEPAPSSTCQPVPVSSAQATVKNTQPPEPVSVTHPVVISTPISQPTPTPVPAPRRRAAATQSTSAPAPVSRVGVTGVQPPPVPVPAPRLRAAQVQPDHPRGPAEALQPVPSCSRGSEELACSPISPPLHPPPDPAFHALALSLVRLAEVSPAQAPALLAQAVALSPSLAQSIAQPSATPTPAQPLASPTSVHSLPSPVQPVHSPAVQLPAQSVHSPAVQLPAQSAPSPAVQPPAQSAPSPAVQPPAQSAPSPAVQPPAQSAPSPAVQPPALPVHSPAVQLPVQPVHSPVAQSPALVQSPVAHSPALVQSPVAQSPAPLQSVVQPAPLHALLPGCLLSPSHLSSSLSSQFSLSSSILLFSHPFSHRL
ncbi:vesicle-associated membrane protein 2 [Sarotherodon galilaeus]